MIYQQAKHDGLCGFYAALNALRYLIVGENGRTSEDEDQNFFDDVVESLARTPGVDIRILKGDSDIGGIDPHQIAALCRDFVARHELPISIDLVASNPKIGFSKLYRTLLNEIDTFAYIAPHRDETHWIVAFGADNESFKVIDKGKVYPRILDDRVAPQLLGSGGVLLRQVEI